ETNDDAFDEQICVVAPRKDGKTYREADVIAFRKNACEPLGFCWRRGHASAQAAQETRHALFVGEIGLALLRGEIGFFAKDEAEIEECLREHKEDRSRRRHEDGNGERKDEGSEVERVAHIAVWAGGNDSSSVHG